MGNLVDDPTTYSLEQLDQALKSERKKYAMALHNAISKGFLLTGLKTLSTKVI